jgi:hypothetical protein
MGFKPLSTMLTSHRLAFGSTYIGTFFRAIFSTVIIFKFRRNRFKFLATDLTGNCDLIAKGFPLTLTGTIFTATISDYSRYYIECLAANLTYPLNRHPALRSRHDKSPPPMFGMLSGQRQQVFT